MSSVTPIEYLHTFSNKSNSIELELNRFTSAYLDVNVCAHRLTLNLILSSIRSLSIVALKHPLTLLLFIRDLIFGQAFRRLNPLIQITRQT